MESDMFQGRDSSAEDVESGEGLEDSLDDADSAEEESEDIECEEDVEDGSEGAASAEEESEDIECDDAGDDTGNRGMADVISKILGKRVPEDKPAILSKRKIRKEDVEEKDSKPKKKKKKQKGFDHQAWEDLQHVIPDGSRSEKERDFRRIATRGVVKLFNAVNKHQKDLDKELKKPGTTEAKRSKAVASVSKDNFLNMLRDGHGATNESRDKRNVPSSASGKKTKTEGLASSSGWAVLQDNFMMGAKLKDWDKDSTLTAESDNDNEDFGDSDSDEN